MMLSDEELDQRLEASPAPRVTTEYMNSRITNVETIIRSFMTICIITLDNGFKVVGESACVNPENYDDAIGRRVAYDNAYQKLWPLFGFLLAEQNMRSSQKAV